MKAVLEGDKLMKEVLNGGYNVHPVPREIPSTHKIKKVSPLIEEVNIR